MGITSSGGTSLARSSECFGLAPPLPATKMLKPFSVAMRPKLLFVSIFRGQGKGGEGTLYSAPQRTRGRSH